MTFCPSNNSFHGGGVSRRIYLLKDPSPNGTRTSTFSQYHTLEGSLWEDGS